jgi:hypothetical protein
LDAFSIATEVLGDLKLTSGQLGQLRALDYRLLLELHRLSERAQARMPPPGKTPVQVPGTAAGATPEEIAALREMLVADILAMLTPEQRAAVNRG